MISGTMILRSLVSLVILSSAASAQLLWAPKAPPGKYTGPHKPITRFKELKAQHAGQKAWRQVIVDDELLHSEWVQLAPGAKTPRVLHPDTRSWWVIHEGKVKFNIETQEPFVASKGSMVQVPMQTLYDMEVVSDEPALFFETKIANARTVYANEADIPKIPGFEFMPVRITSRVVGQYLRNNKAHTTFDEVAQGLESGKLKGTIKIVEDDRGAANFIYGYEKNLPGIGPRDRGHYHPESAEYWLVMKNQIRYLIEGQGVIIADEGDVVYVPKFTFHMPRWYGAGPSCRLAMNGYPNLAHCFDFEGK
jgi:mannose-6-phosphate isomerase-like protein (cupin superfamily)